MLENVSKDVRALLAAKDVKDEIHQFVDGLENDIKHRKDRVFDVTISKPLNDIMGGMRRGELIVVGARPSNGKSALLLSMIMDIAKQGKKVHFFSLEMSVRQCVERIFCAETNISLNKLYTESTLKEIGEVGSVFHRSLNMMWAALDNVKFTLSDGCGKDYEEILTLIEYNNGFDAIVIDYAQMIRQRNNTQRESIDEYLKSLRQLAIDKNMCIILASQINRGAGDGTRVPGSWELKSTGALEEVADKILILHRPWLYNKSGNAKETDMIVDVAKNRQGRTGRGGLEFFGEYFKFRSKIDEKK